MNRRLTSVLFSASTLLVTVPPTATGESIADAWRMALGADGAYAASRSSREAAESDRAAAARQRLPTVIVNGSYTQFENAPMLDIATPAGQLQAPIWKHDGYGMAGADVSIPLWTSGRISGAIGAADAGVRGAGAKETRSAADLKLAVVEAYMGVFRARSWLEVAESSVASLKAHSDDVQVMYDKEAVTQSDLLAARVVLSNAMQQQLRAANGLRIAIAAYNRRVGQPMDRVPSLDAPDATHAAMPRGGLEQLVDHAWERRPELAAVAAQGAEFQEAARAEHAEALPQVSLHAGYNHIDNLILDRQNFASVGVGFQWKLFDSGQVRAWVAALRSRSRAADQQLADLRSQVALEVATALLDSEEAVARARVAAESIAQAEENLRLARELYGSGLGTNTQVLDAEALRVMARTNRDTATFDVAVTVYRLQHALGDL